MNKTTSKTPQTFNAIWSDYYLTLFAVSHICFRYTGNRYELVQLLGVVGGFYVFYWLRMQEEVVKKVVDFYVKYKVITWIIRILLFVYIFRLIIK